MRASFMIDLQDWVAQKLAPLGAETGPQAKVVVAKKANKEALPGDSGCGSPDAEGELPAEDESTYPQDLEDKMKGESTRCT